MDLACLSSLEENAMSVAIVGVGQTPFSRRCGISIRELCFDSFKAALEDINLTPKEIDASIEFHKVWASRHSCCDWFPEDVRDILGRGSGKDG